jgi:hypothetical protein
MKILIHAGIHRTGTTSIQTILAENRELLRSHGIAYPGEDKNHQSLAWALKRGECPTANLAKLLETCAGFESVVFSAEDFCILSDLGWVHDLSRIYETRVLFYLRRQDHWMMSWYNQHVKWPFSLHISQMDKTSFLGCIDEFHWLDYAKLLGRWADAVATGQVIPAIVEDGQIENVVTDLFRHLQLPPDALETATRRQNDSLPVHLLEIARHLGLHDLPTRPRARLIRALKISLENKVSNAKTVFSPEERISVLRRFEDSNREAARRWLGRDSLFLEPPPAPDDPWFDFPDLSRDELLREWIAPVIHNLLPPP